MRKKLSCWMSCNLTESGSSEPDNDAQIFSSLLLPTSLLFKCFFLSSPPWRIVRKEGDGRDAFGTFCCSKLLALSYSFSFYPAPPPPSSIPLPSLPPPSLPSHGSHRIEQQQYLRAFRCVWSAGQMGGSRDCKKWIEASNRRDVLNPLPHKLFIRGP